MKVKADHAHKSSRLLMRRYDVEIRGRRVPRHFRLTEARRAAPAQQANSQLCTIQFEDIYTMTGASKASCVHDILELATPCNGYARSLVK